MKQFIYIFITQLSLFCYQKEPSIDQNKFLDKHYIYMKRYYTQLLFLCFPFVDYKFYLTHYKEIKNLYFDVGGRL